MKTSKKIIAISGSLREKSYNTWLLKAAQKLSAEKSLGLDIEIADISAFPLFNQDLEANFPPVVQALKDKIIASDGVIFATPEYNRSVPGVLKNAIDWLSRPYGKNAFAGKKALLMGASIGAIGTAVAQSHLKQILLYLSMQEIGQPEFYLGHAQEKFDANGNLTDKSTEEHIVKSLGVLM